jgi:PIN domain nuclease of toxin-antitoxin system
LDAHAERRELAIAAITLWETQMLHAKRRVKLPLPLATWLQEAAVTTQVIPLDVDVVVALDGLPVSFHGDPADRIIVASARDIDRPPVPRAPGAVLAGVTEGGARR